MASASFKFQDMDMATAKVSSKRKRAIAGGEIGGERYLCLGSMFNIFCVDLHETREKHKASCRLLTDAPPAAVIVWNKNVSEIDFPIGMTSTNFKFNYTKASSNSSSASESLYLIGGELHDAERHFCSSVEGSSEIYQLIPKFKGDHLIDLELKKADLSIPRMKSGKANPIVEEIAGNLYVLHTSHLCTNRLVPNPSFEVFDSPTGKWRSLDTPFDQIVDGIIVLAHTVIRDWLVIHTTKGIYYFDTKDEKWSYSETMTQSLFNCVPMSVLSAFAIDQEGRDVLVGIGLLGEPSAFLINAEGRLLAKHLLPDIFRDMVPHPADPIDESVLIPLKSKELGVFRMCACACVKVNFCGPVLLISIFSAIINPTSQNRIKKLLLQGKNFADDHASTNFLDVHVEHKFVLKVPGVQFGFFHLTGPAFFL